MVPNNHTVTRMAPNNQTLIRMALNNQYVTRMAPNNQYVKGMVPNNQYVTIITYDDQIVTRMTLATRSTVIKGAYFFEVYKWAAILAPQTQSLIMTMSVLVTCQREIHYLLLRECIAGTSIFLGIIKR